MAKRSYDLMELQSYAEQLKNFNFKPAQISQEMMRTLTED